MQVLFTNILTMQRLLLLSMMLLAASHQVLAAPQSASVAALLWPERMATIVEEPKLQTPQRLPPTVTPLKPQSAPRLPPTGRQHRRPRAAPLQAKTIKPTMKPTRRQAPDQLSRAVYELVLAQAIHKTAAASTKYWQLELSRLQRDCPWEDWEISRATQKLVLADITEKAAALSTQLWEVQVARIRREQAFKSPLCPHAVGSAEWLAQVKRDLTKWARRPCRRS